MSDDLSRRTFLKTAGATVVAPIPLSAGWDGRDTTLSPLAQAVSGWRGATVPDIAVRHSKQSLPGWIVTTEDDELETLREWVDGSTERVLVSETASRNRMVVAAPPADVLAAGVLDDDGLSGSDYVAHVDLDIEMSHADPLSVLDPEGVWDEHKPANAWATLGRGSLSPDGIAFDEDAQPATLSEVSDAISTGATSSTGAGVTIAVNDTGANVFEGQLFGDGSSGSEIRITAGRNFVSDEDADVENGDYSAIEDGDGHGTWCCSCAGGADGMAPDADLLVGKTLADDGSGSTSDIVDSITWASEQGADILSLSLGSPFWSDALAREITAFLEEGGSAVVVAAGNSRGQWIASPGDVPGVIGVGAANYTLDAADSQIAYFSQTGPDGGVADQSGGESRGARPLVSAPGMKVSAPVSPSRDRELSGTSMATPAVAGGLAVSLSADGSLKGDPEALREHVETTAADTPKIGRNEGGAGRFDVANLLAGEEIGHTESSEAEARDVALEAAAGHLGRLAVRTNTIEGLFGGP